MATARRPSTSGRKRLGSSLPPGALPAAGRPTDCCPGAEWPSSPSTGAGPSPRPVRSSIHPFQSAGLLAGALEVAALCGPPVCNCSPRGDKYAIVVRWTAAPPATRGFGYRSRARAVVGTDIERPDPGALPRRRASEARRTHGVTPGGPADETPLNQELDGRSRAESRRGSVPCTPDGQAAGEVAACHGTAHRRPSHRRNPRPPVAARALCG